MSDKSLNMYVNRCVQKLDDSLPKSPTKREETLERVASKPQFKKFFVKFNFKRKRRLGVNKAKACKLVKEFWKDSECIRDSPNKEDVIELQGGGFMHRRYLILTLREAHALYMEENPSHPCSLSWFASLRPYFVDLLEQIPHTTCLCIHCSNYERQYNALIHQCKFTHLPDWDRHTLESMVCQSSTNQCWNNACRSCKGGLGFLSALGEVDQNKAKNVVVSQWVKKKEITSKGVEYTRTALDKVAFPDLIKHMQGSTVDILKHHYVRCHQSAAYQHISDHVLSEDAAACTCQANDDEKCWYHTLVIQLDFSENYKMQYQKEVQPAHYCQPGLSLFTVAVSFQGKFYSSCIVSPHTAHVIEEVLPYVTAVLSEYMTSDVEEVQIFTDGARQQFKTSAMMRSLKFLAKTFKTTIHWNFMASYHGKGRSDGIGAVLKKGVWLRVLAGKTCQSYKHFVDIARKAKINISLIPWTSKTEETYWNTYHLDSWLTDPVNSKTINNITLFHHFCTTYNSTTNLAGKLEMSQISQVDGVQIPVTCDESDLKDDDDCAAEDRGSNDVVDVTDEDDEDNEDTQVYSSVEVSEDEEFGQGGMRIPQYEDAARETYFIEVLEQIQQCSTWDELEEVISNNTEKVTGYELVLPSSARNAQNTVDAAASLMVNELCDPATPVAFKAISISADGDCMTKSVSSLLTGSENTLNIELKVRILFELTMNSFIYQSTSFLEKGLDQYDNEPPFTVPLADYYAQSSDCNPNLLTEPSTSVEINPIFQMEVLDYAKAGHFAGFWQLHALATVLKTCIHTCSAEKGDHAILCNRTFVPRDDNIVGSKSDTVRVLLLWSYSADGDGHRSRHFVPVIGQP